MAWFEEGAALISSAGSNPSLRRLPTPPTVRAGSARLEQSDAVEPPRREPPLAQRTIDLGMDVSGAQILSMVDFIATERGIQYELQPGLAGYVVGGSSTDPAQSIVVTPSGPGSAFSLKSVYPSIVVSHRPDNWDRQGVVVPTRSQQIDENVTAWVEAVIDYVERRLPRIYAQLELEQGDRDPYFGL
jgi:hypothetical protein